MTEPARAYDESHVTDLLPDRRESDIPQAVQFFLSVCEAATTSYRYQDWHLEEPQTYFCEGVVDYWWNDELDEPYWEQLYYKNLDDGHLRHEPMPSHDRFCYQQGAIVGYRLREEYGGPE